MNQTKYTQQNIKIKPIYIFSIFIIMEISLFCTKTFIQYLYSNLIMHITHIDIFFFSLKLECDKLAQEKTEIQRQYIMVSFSSP